MPNPMDPTQPSRPEYPKSPEQPVVPPDDPNRPDVEREPNIDPPPTAPPMEAPSEKPVITEPPSPRAQPAALQTDFPGLSSFAWIAAVVISVATLPAQQAPDNITVQLRNGQIVRGALEDLEGGTLYVRVTRDDQRRLPIGEVALIDRVGGASGLPETELREARHPEHVAFLTTGGSVTGKLVDIAGGAGSAAGEENKERRFIFQLPDGRGTEATALIKQERPATTVVMLTSQADGAVLVRVVRDWTTRVRLNLVPARPVVR